jgi:hypothetical protein
MFKTKSSASLTMLSLLVSMNVNGVVFNETQTSAIIDKMQHSMSVANAGLVEEGRIHNISKVYSAGRIAVGTESKYIHTFLANDDNSISYYGMQTLATDNNYNNSVNLSPDGKFLYLKSSTESSYKVTVMAFDVDTKSWVEKSSYAAINGQNISSNDVIEISKNGAYIFIKNQYNRYVSIAKRDMVTGALSAVKLLSTTDKLPSVIYNVEFDESNQVLLVSGEGRSYNSTDPLVAYQLDSTNNTVSEIARLARNGNYHTISNVLYDQATKNIFSLENNNINIYKLDVAGKALTLKYSASSYSAFNEYVDSNSLSLVSGQLFVQSYNSMGKLYNYNDGVTPSVTLAKTVTTNVDLNSLSKAGKLGWKQSNQNIELYESNANSYDYSKKSSIKDGQQNLPQLANSSSRKVLIESLGIIVVIGSEGVTSINADSTSKTSLFSADWSKFGIAGNRTPYIQSITVDGDELLIAGRYFSDDNWRNDKFIALKVAADGTVSGGLKSLVVSGNPLYYTDFAVFDKANNLAIFRNDNGNYAFFSLDANNKATFIDVLDSSLVGDSYYIQIGFADGKPFVWDRSASKFYWVDVDVTNKDIDLSDAIDLSGTIPADAKITQNAGNLYFINSEAVSSYKVNTDLSLSFMSVSFISNLNNRNLAFISEDYVVNTNYNGFNAYGVDRESGSWKLLSTTQASDYGLAYFQDYNVSYSDGLKQKAIFGVQGNDSLQGLMIADFSSSPVLKAPMMPVLANEGEKVELNITDFVFDADTDDLLTFSSDTLPNAAVLSEAGLLTLETKISDSGDMKILVTDSKDMTLTVSVPFYANAAPVVGTIEKYWVNPGENIALDLATSVTDPEGQSITFTKEAGSALEVNKHGQVYGKLTSAGEYSVLAKVTDSLGAKASLSAKVQVNSAPSSASLSPLLAKTTAAVIADVSAAFTDADGHSLTFTAVGLPAGLTMSLEGRVTGSATSSGKTTAVVTATDSKGLSSNSTLVVDVTDESSGGGSMGYIALLLLPLALRRKYH